MRNGRKTLLAFLTLALMVGALWLTNGSVSLKKATWADVVSEAQKGEYRLLTTDALWKVYHQHRDKLLLVDTRQEWEYRAGHIQGAVNFPMAATRFARWWQKGKLDKLLGSDKDRFIVFYCAGLA